MDTFSCAAFSISPQKPSSRIGTAAAPLILDVRPPHRFAEATHILAGAQRCEAEKLEQVASTFLPGEVVVYCVYGHQVSQDAATLLRKAWCCIQVSGQPEAHSWKPEIMTGASA